MIATVAGSFKEGGLLHLLLPYYAHGSLGTWVEVLRTTAALTAPDIGRVRNVFGRVPLETALDANASAQSGRVPGPGYAARCRHVRSEQCPPPASSQAAVAGIELSALSPRGAPRREARKRHAAVTGKGPPAARAASHKCGAATFQYITSGTFCWSVLRREYLEQWRCYNAMHCIR